MPTSVRETCVAGVLAELEAIASISGLDVVRNQAVEFDRFPALNLVDADSDARIVDRGRDVELWALDLEVEGYVAATTDAAVGPAADALAAAAQQAAAAAEASVAEIDEVLVGAVQSTLIDEDGVAPHVFFTITVELRFGTVAGDPYTQA